MKKFHKLMAPALDFGVLTVAVLVLGVLATTTSPALASTVTTIDVPGAGGTSANGINGRGQIVGTYYAGGIEHGFLLDSGTFTTIDVPGARYTRLNGINGRGQIVGYYFGDEPGHGFLLDSGTFTTIDFPGAGATKPFGINDRGQIVGEY